MPGPEHSDISFPDPVELSHNFARIAERTQRLVVDFLTGAPEFSGLGMADPRVDKAFLELTVKMLSDPMALARAKSTSGPSTPGCGPRRRKEFSALPTRARICPHSIPASGTRPGAS